MKEVFSILLILGLIGCVAHISPYRDKSIIKIIVKENPSSKSIAISDSGKIETVQIILKKIASVKREWLHNYTTFVPLDHSFILIDKNGHEYYYQISSKFLRTQKATWPITFQEYLVLSNALGI